MRIVEVCTSGSLGGLELYFATCCRKLQERSHDVLAIVKPNSKLHEKLKNEVDCLLCKNHLINDYFFLKKELKRWSPERVHVHHKKDVLLVALLKRFSGLGFKYVHTRQMDFPGKKKDPYHSFIYQSMDLIIAITDRLKKQMTEHLNVEKDRVVRLYYGVPSVPPQPRRCAEIDINEGFFNIGVIARIDRKKEQHVMVEALTFLSNQGVDGIRAYLVGGSTDDLYFDSLKKQINSANLEETVFITGFIESPQEIMTCFDTVVLTTGIETFGLVLPEAMRQGVAVVGAAGGGVPEIIDNQETGLLFTPGNASELSGKIKALMDTDYRKKISSAGKAKADKRFDIEDHFSFLEGYLIL